MKTWILETNRVQGLYSYVCYCEENPADLLIEDNDYSDEYNSMMSDLYDSFGYLYKEDLSDDDIEDWTSEDWDMWEDEQFNDFCDGVSFNAYETTDEDLNKYPILIDDRKININ